MIIDWYFKQISQYSTGDRFGIIAIYIFVYIY